VILPREEGKAAIDTSPKKIKKTKSLVRAKKAFSLLRFKLLYDFFFVYIATSHSYQNWK
jgi:hypothetical protein